MSDKAAEKPVIKLQKDGPLRVSGLGSFQNSDGQDIAVKKTMHLCRCGASKTKPFCDGTHVSVGFTDAKEDDRVPDKLEEYTGPKVQILDNRGVCSHAGYCTSGLPGVWRSGVEPWINPDGASAEEIVKIVRMCPSGALSYEQNDKRETEYSDRPEIQITRDGPYRVRGGVVLDGAPFGEGASREHYTLCRCGKSSNKPFCDGTHWYAGFKDDEGLTISQAGRGAGRTVQQWTRVGKVDEFEPDRVHAVSVGDKTIALVKTADAWHALDGLCPHQGGPLTEGELCDDAIRCPWHGYDFAIADGKGRDSDDQVEKYDVRENEGHVEVAVPGTEQSTWTVSDVVAHTMVEWGVDTVFGMVGHSNLGLSDAIRDLAERGKVRFFGIRHEGAAAFACSGYAKVSGRPAACLTIAGPGATNLLTGLWDAKVDRAPVLALTGQVNTQVLGPGAFQEIDITSAFAAVSSFSQTVLQSSNHAELASLALKAAIVERDVAHLIFPDEVQTQDAGSAGPGRPEGRVSRTEIAPSAGSIDNAVYRIGRARRPAIIVGYGARESMAAVIALAEKLHAPVITTFKAKGLIGDDHPLGAGVLGRSGTPVAARFMNEADLLLVFGASFASHTGIATNKPIIQVDFERMALGKFHRVDEAVWGDIGQTAGLLCERLEAGGGFTDQRTELAGAKESWRSEKAKRARVDNGKGINSAIIFRELAQAVPADAIMSVDVGNNTYSFGRYFECARQSVILSGYLGSIGFGFPAAMGAWAAAPDRMVVSVSGDGGFAQYMAEFMTAVKYGMSITHVLLNNSELGKISKEQRDGAFKIWQTDLHNLNFAEYARLCGGFGVRVTEVSDLATALRDALAAKGPSLVEIMTDPLLV